MNELILDAYKRGYLKDYKTTSIDKDADSYWQSSPMIDRLMNILVRYTKSNIILGDSNITGKCQMLDHLLNRIYRKTGVRELDNLRIYLFDPTIFAENYGFSGLANKHIKYLFNTIGKDGNALIVINDISKMLYDSYVSRSNTELIINVGVFNDLVKQNKIKFIGRAAISDKIFNDDLSMIQRKWGDYVELVRMPDIALREKQDDRNSASIDSHWLGIEKHYGINIDPNIMKTCIRLADKYIKEGQMPYKAIALCDEAIARNKVEYRNIHNASSVFVLKEEMLIRIISEKTGISINKIKAGQHKQTDILEELLSSKIIGQEQAAKVVAQAMRTVKSGFKDRKGPDGIFYFVGPSGVGKTEFAMTLADILYGNTTKLLRIDMSELIHYGDASRLVGSAPGYIGYEDGGILTEWGKKNPSSIILLDEFEKAHPLCWDIFLQIFDAGRLTDGKGEVVDFSNTIIIMTSNIGSDCFIDLNENKSIGFTGKDALESNVESIDLIYKTIYRRIMKEFRPEFINRIDEIVYFKPLSIDNLMEITRQMIRNIPVKIIIDENIVKFLATNGYNPRFGARHLKRTLKKYIHDPIANMIADKQCVMGDTIRVVLEGDSMLFRRN